MADITHSSDLAASYAQREPLLAGESDFFQMEKRYYHKDGHVLWGLTNVSLVRDARGQPLYYVGQVQDVTERKRVEAEARIAAAERNGQQVVREWELIPVELQDGREAIVPVESIKPVWLEDVNEQGVGKVATSGIDCREFYWGQDQPIRRADGTVAATDLLRQAVV